MSLEKGSRVVIAQGPARGLRGTFVAKDARSGNSQIACDNGQTYWFVKYARPAFFPEDSEEARALLAQHAARVGAADLDADLAFAAAVVAERRRPDVLVAVERIARHADERALFAHLDLVPIAATPGDLAGKPPGWLPPPLIAYVARADADVIGPAVDRLRRWFAEPSSRPLVGLVARALARTPDPRLVDVLRELTAIAPSDRGVLDARLLLGDAMVYADLAAGRVVERDGRAQLHVGGLSPGDASQILVAIGARAEDVTHLAVADGGRDLDAWLAWPELARFRRLDFDNSFRGAEPLARVLSSPHLAADLEYLSLGGCDIGTKGCKALAGAERLASLRELQIDAGDYDRTTWGPTCLSALFPEGGALAKLERLVIRGWKVDKSHVTKLISANRAALRTVQIGWQTPALVSS